MLRPSKLNAGSVSYYESTTERQPVQIGTDMTDYYSEHGDRAPTVWVAGRSDERKAETLGRLGITEGQELTAEQVEQWFNEGVAPGGDHEQLGRKYVGPSVKRMPVKDEHGRPVLDAAGEPLTFEKANGGTVRGWDLVVAAPKSVSMLHAIGDEWTRETIEAGHRYAIARAMDYLGQHGGYTRVRTPGAKEASVVPSSALSGVVYEHRTSRNVDPHLHAHVLLHNRVLDPASGEWVSIDGTSMMHETKPAGMVYQATLRSFLTSNLSVTWQHVDPRSGVADLTGLSREQIEDWSSRSGEIDQWCADHGLDGNAADHKAAQLETRVAKDTSHSDAQLRAMWGDRARAQGITAREIGRGPVLGPGDVPLTNLEQFAIEDAPQVTAEDVLRTTAEQMSTFTRADLVESAAASLSEYQGAPRDVLATIEGLADEAAELAVSLEGAASAGDAITRRLRSGQRLGEREGSIRYATVATIELEATTTTRAAQRVAGLAGDPTLVPAGGLDLDQLAGMRQLVASDRLVSVMVAPAGAGKTTSLKAGRSAWEHDGRRVLGIAPTGRAAGQMRTDGAVEQADTIATVLGRLRRGKGSGWQAGDVVIVDEAGMVGSFTLARLIEQAEADQVRMVLVGDPEQLQAVNEASGMFELLAEDLPDTVRLTQVYRQADPEEREAGLGLRSDASEAQMRAAVRWYADHDLIAAGDRFTMFEDTLEDWRWAAGQGWDAMMLAGTWDDAEALALTAQQWLVEQGMVDHGVTVPLGDHDENGRNRSRPTVAGVGDLVMTRANDYELRTDQGETVRNGNTWRVDRIQPSHAGTETRVWLSRTGSDNPDRVWVPASYLAEHARLAYGSSINNSQGATMDAALDVFEEGRSAQNLVYTGMTRGRFMNKARIVTAAENVEGHEHQGEPARFRAPTEQAASMFADLVGRDRRDLSAHITAERAARAARQAITEQRGPELADEFEDAARFTPAARALTARDERAAQARNAPDPTAEAPQAVGQNRPNPFLSEQPPVTPRRVSEQPAGQAGLQQTETDITGPVPVRPVMREGAPAGSIRAKLPTIPESAARPDPVEQLEAGWDAVEEYRTFDQSAQKWESWVPRRDRARDQFVATYGQTPEQWATEHPHRELTSLKMRRNMDQLREMNGRPPAVYSTDPVPVNFPDRHFEQLEPLQRSQLWAHRDSPELGDTARRVYETAYAHDPGLAGRDQKLAASGPAAWREALTSIEDGQMVPPIAWVRDTSIVERVTADRAAENREYVRAMAQEAAIPDEAREARDTALGHLHGTPQERIRRGIQQSRTRTALDKAQQDREAQERRLRDYGRGPDTGRGGPSMGR